MRSLLTHALVSAAIVALVLPLQIARARCGRRMPPSPTVLPSTLDSQTQ